MALLLFVCSIASMAEAIVAYDGAGVDDASVEAASKVFRCVVAGLPQSVFDTVCKSPVAIHLVPVTSDFSQAPERCDLEQHFKLLTELMKAFDEKAPMLSTLVAGLT